MGRKKHVCQTHGFLAESDQDWKAHIKEKHHKSLDNFQEIQPENQADKKDKKRGNVDE